MGTEIILLAIPPLCLWFLIYQRSTNRALDNIRGPTAKSFIKGSFSQVYQVGGWDFNRQLWREYSGVAKITGMLGQSMLYLSDHLALQHVLVKDQDRFSLSPSLMLSVRLMFGPGLLSDSGALHVKQRRVLNPVFSIAQIRPLTPIFHEVADQLKATLLGQIMASPTEINIYPLIGRATLELIGRSGFGFSFGDISSSDDNPYSRGFERLLPLSFNLVWFRAFILRHVVKIGSPGFLRSLIGWLPSQSLQELRDISDTFYAHSINLYQSKKAAIFAETKGMADHLGEKRDLLSVLMKSNLDASARDKFSDTEIHSLIRQDGFMFAAMDTTSNSLAAAIWRLALNQDVQLKLRKEMRLAKQALPKGVGLPYDDLISLPYLDAICRETLRVNPPAPMTQRYTLKGTVLPLSKPVRGVDGKDTHEIFVPKGVSIVTSILGYNTDPSLWGPTAQEWDPERWLIPSAGAIPVNAFNGSYSSMLTFSAGNHSCIGSKFALLGMKAILSNLIDHFEFKVSKDIEWRMTTIIQPTVMGDARDSKPRLPLIVGLAER